MGNGMPDSESRRFIVDTSSDRIDRFMDDCCPDLTRSRVAKLIKNGSITLNGRNVKPATTPHIGDVIEVTLVAERFVGLAAQPIPISVIYQDHDVLVLDKPFGLTVHPGPGHTDNTLVNGLLALLPDLADVGEPLRPGIVHRLDKDTSGLIVVARTDGAYESLLRQLKQRVVTKTYLALVDGVITGGDGEVNGPIGRHPWRRKRMAVVGNGRESKTTYRVIRRYQGHTLLEVYPLTGRTHQIRVHMSSVGHPVTGDTTYGRSSSIIQRQFLHALRLGFYLPPSERDWKEFHAPIPDDLQAALEHLTNT
jgi:23S rRNA pseudouridine1911/1915/1917 synthase